MFIGFRKSRKEHNFLAVKDGWLIFFSMCPQMISQSPIFKAVVGKTWTLQWRKVVRATHINALMIKQWWWRDPGDSKCFWSIQISTAPQIGSMQHLKNFGLLSVGKGIRITISPFELRLMWNPEVVICVWLFIVLRKMIVFYVIQVIYDKYGVLYCKAIHISQGSSLGSCENNQFGLTWIIYCVGCM